MLYEAHKNRSTAYIQIDRDMLQRSAIEIGKSVDFRIIELVRGSSCTQTPSHEGANHASREPKLYAPIYLIVIYIHQSNRISRKACHPQHLVLLVPSHTAIYYSSPHSPCRHHSGSVSQAPPQSFPEDSDCHSCSASG